MPQVGSFAAISANVLLAFSYQKECSIATALLNSAWTDGSHETEKFTLPSLPGSPAGCSCWARAGGTGATHAPALSSIKTKAGRFMMASLIASGPGMRSNWRDYNPEQLATNLQSLSFRSTGKQEVETAQVAAGTHCPVLSTIRTVKVPQDARRLVAVF